MLRRFQLTFWVPRFAVVGLLAAIVCGCSGTGQVSTGLLYVADTGNNRLVREQDFYADYWYALGTWNVPGTAKGYLNVPEGAYHDSSGNLYIADTGNNRIVFSQNMSGTGWSTFGSLGSGVGHFNGPTGIYLDSSNRIYIADTNNNRIVRMDNMTGTNWTTFTGAGTGFQLNGPTGVFAVGSGTPIYVADRGNNRIIQMTDMTGAGAVSYGQLGSTTSGAAANGQGYLHDPFDVFVDAENRIYITDSGNDRVIQISDIQGDSWTAYGTPGSLTNNFSNPCGIYVNSSYQIYVADTANYRVVRSDDMTGSGFISTGGSGYTNGYFNLPQGVFVY